MCKPKWSQENKKKQQGKCGTKRQTHCIIHPHHVQAHAVGMEGGMLLGRRCLCLGMASGRVFSICLTCSFGLIYASVLVHIHLG